MANPASRLSSMSSGVLRSALLALCTLRPHQEMRKHAGEVNIIVTHWPPTLHALHPMYARAGSTEVLLNRYFINDKETLVHEMGATLWIEAPAAPEEPASKTTGGRDASCKHSGPRARGRRPRNIPSHQITKCQDTAILRHPVAQRCGHRPRPCRRRVHSGTERPYGRSLREQLGVRRVGSIAQATPTDLKPRTGPSPP